MDLLAVIVALLIGLAVGVVIGHLRASGALRPKVAGAEATTTALRAQVEHHERLYRELDERVSAERSLATEREALERNAVAERQANERRAQAERDQSENRVLQLLTPVQETLRAMNAKVSELEAQRHLQHGEITQQLRSANESEERLRATAESLASALRNNATRGVWGETQLRNVVEAAGLLERVDFDVQSSISSDAGAGRPDMVVHLPGRKSIAVDAKVPFNSFLLASAIPATATGEEAARRAALLKEHVKAVRAHIDTLASKAYWAGLDASPEIVIAFIPSESLVSSAMEADPGIMDYAFSKRVALASPVTLWSVLKTVAYSWQQNVLTDDAKVLFDLSRELYTRLSTMAGHVEKLGRSLTSTIGSYNSFIGSLERQVLPTARKLNVLDETRVLGTLVPIEETTRDLTAFELVAELESLAAADPLDELGATAGHHS